MKKGRPSREIRRMSPIRAIRRMIFEHEEAKWIRMSQDAYVRDEGYKEAEAKYQEQIRQEQEKLTAREEQIRQLEEEVRQLRGE
jgi:hypothetical protein